MADELTVADAVDELAKARTPADLATAHRVVKQTVQASRRRHAATHGRLARAYVDAMDIVDAQKAAGVPLLERLKGLEPTLRDAWPQTREWHYLCSLCNDIGLEMRTCPGDATCGRSRAHLTHEYGKPCWCPKGARFKDKAKPDPEDFAAAGKSKPMTRIGRR